jgi:hypothetical protein
MTDHDEMTGTSAWNDWARREELRRIDKLRDIAPAGARRGAGGAGADQRRVGAAVAAGAPDAGQGHPLAIGLRYPMQRP